MAQLPIPYGAIPNDPNQANDIPLRTAFQRTHDNFTDLYAVQSRTVNAGDVRFSGQPTAEAKIQAAIDQAALELASAVFVPAFMLPYNANLVTFNNNIRMIREGGESTVWDVRAYGAKGDAVQDDYANINAAINGCAAALGGVVYFPKGAYKVNTVVVIPITQSFGMVLRGAGMRNTTIRPGTEGMTAVRFGTDTPDPSGTSTNVMSYCGMEDISVNGSLLTTSAAIGVQMTETQDCWLRNVLIEAFPGASIGLYLRGSTTTGIGAASAPHVWRNEFDHVLSVTCQRPCVIENADECVWINCDFGIQPGVTAAANSLKGIEVIQGRNHRFYGALVQGDTNLGFRAAYTGVKLGPVTKGDVKSFQFYGLVAEGHNKPLWIVDTLVLGTQVYGYNSSICAEEWDNAGFPAAATEPGNGTVIVAPLLGNQFYIAGSLPYGDVKSMSLSAGNNTPSVVGGNIYVTSGNAGGSNIIGFSQTNTKFSQEIWLRLDANTTVVDASQGGTNIRCWGRKNIKGIGEAMVCFRMFGSGPTWYQMSPVTRDIAAGDTVATSESVLVSGINASEGSLFQTTLTAARVVGAPLQMRSGQTITYSFIQDGTGGWAVTWNAVFKGLTWSDTGNTAGKRTSVSFVSDGTNLNQVGAQAPYAT